MKPKLPNEISSQQDLKTLIMDIQAYAKWYSQTSVQMKYDKDLKPAAPITSASAAAVIGEWAGDQPLTREELDKLINSLKEIEETAPKVTITLAAPASGNLKKSIAEWFRANVNPDVLVNFKFNSTILGGMVVNYGSHIFDWSFRRKILANRDKFPEVLRNV